MQTTGEGFPSQCCIPSPEIHRFPLSTFILEFPPPPSRLIFACYIKAKWHKTPAILYTLILASGQSGLSSGTVDSSQTALLPCEELFNGSGFFLFFLTTFCVLRILKTWNFPLDVLVPRGCCLLPIHVPRARNTAFIPSFWVFCR